MENALSDDDGRRRKTTDNDGRRRATTDDDGQQRTTTAVAILAQGRRRRRGLRHASPALACRQPWLHRARPNRRRLLRPPPRRRRPVRPRPRRGARPRLPPGHGSLGAAGSRGTLPPSAARASLPRVALRGPAVVGLRRGSLGSLRVLCSARSRLPVLAAAGRESRLPSVPESCCRVPSPLFRLPDGRSRHDA